jgi:hypothetical protein
MDISIRSLAILLLLGIAACSKNQPAAPPSTGSTVVPKVGSRFVFQTYEVDTHDIEKGGTRGFDTVTVVQSGLHSGGKSDVLAMRYSRTGELAYYHYESNGDIAVAYDSFDGIWPAWTWHTFPVGSHARIPGVTADGLSGGDGVVHTDTLSFLADESVNVNGVQIACAKLREEIIAFSHTGGAIDSRTVYQEDYWFAPSLGFFARYSDDGRAFRALTDTVIWKRDDYRMSLVSYELK